MPWMFSRKRQVNRTWKVKVRHREDFDLVEITDPPSMWIGGFRDLYFDLLENVFQKYEVIALSQMIGVGQGWDDIEAFDDLQDYIKSLHRKYSVQAVVTSAYDDPTWPRPNALYFVVHVAGRINRSLMQELMGFGMDSLPNIAYGLESVPASWPYQVYEWNKVFTQWFRFKVKDITLKRSVIDQSQLTFWTEDGHLEFVFADIGEQERLLATIVDLAQKYDLQLVIDETNE
jgi:hypothetical protein